MIKKKIHHCKIFHLRSTNFSKTAINYGTPCISIYVSATYTSSFFFAMEGGKIRDRLAGTRTAAWERPDVELPVEARLSTRPSPWTPADVTIRLDIGPLPFGASSAVRRSAAEVCLGAFP